MSIVVPCVCNFKLRNRCLTNKSVTLDSRFHRKYSSEIFYNVITKVKTSFAVHLDIRLDEIRAIEDLWSSDKISLINLMKLHYQY